jgi:FtsZ-interacting cell division protein ZipA
MDWLRPILLIAGAVFMALLIWWERRRPHRVRGDAYSGSRVEPQLGQGVEREAERGPTPAGVRPAATVEEPRASVREPPRPPPVVDWTAAEVPAPGPTAAARPEPGASHVPAVPAPPDAATSACEPPLIVEWPEEGARRIVTLRILPARHDRLAGRALRQGLTATGFRHGAFGIFHLPELDGRVVLSAASLVRPGMLDPATMDFQRFAGINLFAVLPGPVSDEQALQRLGQVAVELATRVEGQVQDDSGAPFNAAAVAAWRGRCLQAIGNPRSAAGPAH